MFQRVPYAPPQEPGKRYTSLFCALLHPLSRGTVHIASADPRAPPAIDPNYFAHAADLARVVRAVQCALRVYRAAPLAAHVAQQLLPPPAFLARGEAGLRDYVRGTCRQVFHAVGTAAMLPRADGGVVDPALRVYGTDNLRVVGRFIFLLRGGAWADAGSWTGGLLDPSFGMWSGTVLDVLRRWLTSTSRSSHATRSPSRM